MEKRTECIREREAHSRAHPPSSARCRPGLRKDPGLFRFWLQPAYASARPAIDGSHTVRGGRSLTRCRKATAVLADGSPCNFADVAQQEERGHATAEAASSRLAIRSTSGVSMHSAAASHGVDGPGCARPGRAACSETPTSDGALAFGHSRSGLQTLSCSSRWPRTPGFQSGDAGFESRTRRQDNRKPSSSSRFEGGNRPQRLGGAGTRDRMDFVRGVARHAAHHLRQLHCLVNSAARVPACLAGSRGFDSRTRRQVCRGSSAGRAAR
jgi:hypothetical protein